MHFPGDSRDFRSSRCGKAVREPELLTTVLCRRKAEYKVDGEDRGDVVGGSEEGIRIGGVGEDTS
jgi:hypothetical protein